MNYTIVWLIEGHMIDIMADGRMSIAELQQVDQTLTAMLRAYPQHKLYLLTHIKPGVTIPPVTYLNRLQVLREPNFAFSITYGTAVSFAQPLIMLVANLFRLPYRHFRTREEALQFLKLLQPDLFKMSDGR